MTFTFTVVDSGPVDGRNITDRGITIHLGDGRGWEYVLRMTPAEAYEVERSPHFREFWNARFVEEAFRQFYAAIKPRTDGDSEQVSQNPTPERPPECIPNP